MEIKPDLLTGVVFDGYDFGLRFTFIEGINDVLKRSDIAGRFISQRGSRYHRYWKIKKQVIDTSLEDLHGSLMAIAGHSVTETLDSFSRKLLAARERVETDAFIGELSESIYRLSDGGVALIGTYHPGIVALAHTMHARYLAAMKAWRFQSTSATALKFNLMGELLLRDEQVVIYDGEYSIVGDAIQKSFADKPTIATTNNLVVAGPDKQEEKDNAVYLAATAPLEQRAITDAECETMLSSFDLLDYQRTGVRHMLRQSSSLLADDMGLGKSRQSVVAAYLASGNQPILIVCPASLVINWQREIRIMFPDATTAVQRFDIESKWIITNYERLSDMVPHAHRFSVMITDEAHYLKEPLTTRTRLAFDIGAKIRTRILLTGTPVLNRECEIHTLLRLSGHPLGNIPLKQFEDEFAGNPAFRRELNKRISEWMLRRKKDTVLKTLKGKQQQIRFIEPGGDWRGAYTAIANDSTLRALPKIVRLREFMEKTKVRSIIQMIASLPYEDKVIVFCEYTETVALFQGMLSELDIGAVSFIGRDSPTRRQAAIDAMQTEPDTRVLATTTAAGGVGSTVTAANHVVFVSLPWTPALKDQAEDRAYRLGQQRMVLVSIPLLDGTIDNDLLDLHRHKKAIADDILDPDSAVRSEEIAKVNFAKTLNQAA